MQSPSETEQVALDNMVIWTLKLCDQTSLVPYSTENRSTYVTMTMEILYFIYHGGVSYKWSEILVRFDFLPQSLYMYINLGKVLPYVY